MFRRHHIIALALASLALDASAMEDTWTGPDKVKHTLVGAAIGAAVTAATREPLYGTAAGCVAGAGKELIDARRSAKDFIVTCVAAAAGAYGMNWGLRVNERGTIQATYSRTF